MIINGGSRKNGAFFSRHLMRADQNERVDVLEIRGLGAETIPDAFREMKAIASGTQCRNYFYHANLNTRADEVLTPEQWAEAVDTLESDLHLTGQPRFIVQHEKERRVHQHVVWSRIDADSMTAIPDSHNYRTHELVADGLEKAFGHDTTARALTRDKETVERPEPRFKGWEDFRAADTGIDPKAMKAELTALWSRADSGQAFAAALAEQGYILAKGDRRDFCVIDAAGDEHSLGRRLSGVKAAGIRERMADIDREVLPSVSEGRELARERQDAEGGTSAPVERSPDEPTPEREPVAQLVVESPASAFDAILAECIREARAPYVTPIEPELSSPEPLSTFDAILAETVRQARRTEMTRDEPEERFARWHGWWETMRHHVAGLSREVQERFGHYFSRGEPDVPGTTVTGAVLEPWRQPEQDGWGPER